jgi:hypothetical protein
MKYPSIDEVESLVKRLFVPEYNGDKLSISARRDGLAYVIEIERMYDYVPVKLSHLLSLAKFFDTLNINDSRYSSQGCDTCDYGSSYEVTLTVKEGQKP